MIRNDVGGRKKGGTERKAKRHNEFMMTVMSTVSGSQPQVGSPASLTSQTILSRNLSLAAFLAISYKYSHLSALDP